MKILRAVGLLLFIGAAQIIVSDFFEAFNDAAVASLNVIESVANVANSQFEKF